MGLAGKENLVLRHMLLCKKKLIGSVTNLISPGKNHR